MQATKPSKITLPKSAFKVAAIAIAAGWGGNIQWTICKETPIGTPIATMDKPVALATLITNGISKTNPTWKKTGIPVSKPTIIIAQFARFLPNVFINVLANRSAPPDSSSILPRILPSPSTVARKPKVLPIPASMEEQIFKRGIPVKIPT